MEYVKLESAGSQWQFSIGIHNWKLNGPIQIGIMADNTLFQQFQIQKLSTEEKCKNSLFMEKRRRLVSESETLAIFQCVINDERFTQKREECFKRLKYEVVNMKFGIC